MTYPFAFGVRLLSELPLDLLPQVDADETADGPTVRLKVFRSLALPRMEQEMENSYFAQGRRMTIYLGSGLEADTMTAVIDDLLHFKLHLNPEGGEGRITCVASPGATEENIRYWFLQQILPIFLLFNGTTEFLHATAVGLDPNRNGHREGAVCFLGCSGIGKSTLLHYFLQQGDALITDEHLALARARYDQAVPSVPFYRPYRSVEDLGIRAERFGSRPVPLRRMYVLKPAAADAPVWAEPLSDSETVNAVLKNQQYNVFSPRTPHLLHLLARRFSGLAALTRRVPVRRLHVPRALDRLPEVYGFIQNDMCEGS